RSSSFVKRRSTLPSQPLHAWNLSTIHHARPTGGSLTPRASVERRVAWTSVYAPSVCCHFEVASRYRCSSRDRPPGFWKRCQNGTSVKCTPTIDRAWLRASCSVTVLPQSPPCAAKGWYASTSVIDARHTY